MTKYTIETKQRLVELVETKKHSIGSAAKEVGVSESAAKRWIKLYEYHGYEGLLIKRSSYTGEFKKNVVEYMHANHLSIREASAKFGMTSHTTLLNWERIYYEEGEQGLLVDRRGRPRKTMSKKPNMEKKTKEDLIAEVQRLRMENDYLKKYIALAQDERNLEKPKKRK
jgi:transposase